MKKVVFFSLKGGTGRTTLAVNLGAVIHQSGNRCMLFDVDPQNGLGDWLGNEPGARYGLARKSVDATNLMQFTRRNQAQVPYLPFGACTLGEILDLEREIGADPDWLTHKIESLTNGEYDVAILDAPGGYTPWARQALSTADLVIVVLQPDAASYATLPAVEEMLKTHCLNRPEFLGAYYLFNQMDARNSLARDVRAAVGSLLPEVVLPAAAPNEEAVKEALAQQKTVADRFPDSQMVATLRELAAWIQHRVSAETDDIRAI
jgi:cellulose synthase operon protein YhjQ